MQNFQNDRRTGTFWTLFWRLISLGLGVSTNKAVLLLKMLYSLYLKKMRVQRCHHCSDAGERQQTIRQSYPKSDSGRPTVPRRMWNSGQNEHFSGPHWEITVQLHVSGMGLGAYVVNENLTSVCLPPPHARFIFPMYITWYYVPIKLQGFFFFNKGSPVCFTFNASAIFEAL